MSLLNLYTSKYMSDSDAILESQMVTVPGEEGPTSGSKKLLENLKLRTDPTPSGPPTTGQSEAPLESERRNPYQHISPYIDKYANESVSKEFLNGLIFSEFGEELGKQHADEVDWGLKNSAGATGLGQFFAAAWGDFGEGSYDNAADPEQAIKAMVRYSERSARSLEEEGLENSAVNKHLLYIFGPYKGGGGIKFVKSLNENPDSLAFEDFEKAAKNNPYVFYESGRKDMPRTYRQIAAFYQNKQLEGNKRAH